MITIRGQSGEAMIFNRTADREMIQRLKLGAGIKTKYAMNRIVEKAAYTC